MVLCTGVYQRYEYVMLQAGENVGQHMTIFSTSLSDIGKISFNK